MFRKWKRWSVTFLLGWNDENRWDDNEHPSLLPLNLGQKLCLKTSNPIKDSAEISISKPSQKPQRIEGSSALSKPPTPSCGPSPISGMASKSMSFARSWPRNHEKHSTKSHSYRFKKKKKRFFSWKSSHVRGLNDSPLKNKQRLKTLRKKTSNFVPADWQFIGFAPADTNGLLELENPLILR